MVEGNGADPTRNPWCGGDITVTGKSDAEHLENLEKDLRINVKKCRFFMEWIEYTVATD